MPLRLDAIMSDQSSDVLAWLLEKELQSADDAFATKDGRYLHLSNTFLDAKTHASIGRYVFTLFRDEEHKALQILDMDIVLNNAFPVCLEFATRYEPSSDANEYYEVLTEDEQHLCVETVNRHTVPGDILGTKQTVYVSAFPFKVSIYNNLAELNHTLGLDKRTLKIGDDEYTIGGLSDTFTALGRVLSGEQKAEQDPWSTMVGVVHSYQDATLQFGNRAYEVCIVQLKTALGVLPTIMGKERFETDKLSPGKVVLMDACIKANFIQNNYPKKDN